MDNIITGVIAVVIFLAFALGLAESIGELPFVLIVVAVCLMLLVDFYQSARDGLKEEGKNKADST
jgi:4-hydroxybenzoate polyprenyltransferase